LTKICPKCGNEFTLRNSKGIQSYCPPCHNAYRRERHALHYRLDPEEQRRRNYKQNYGITEEDYQRMFEQQGGVCAACGRPETRMNARIKGRLYVDHDHVTGRVRALLCINCNAALGALNDEPQRIEALLAYRLHWK
jgi:DNA-directed RNA polymerase subunit M/transcription elongation factor TFIIS